MTEIIKEFKKPFYPNLEVELKDVTSPYPICKWVNSQRRLKPVPSRPTQQLRGCLPGQDWQLDFTRMTTH